MSKLNEYLEKQNYSEGIVADKVAGAAEGISNIWTKLILKLAESDPKNIKIIADHVVSIIDVSELPKTQKGSINKVQLKKEIIIKIKTHPQLKNMPNRLYDKVAEEVYNRIQK